MSDHWKQQEQSDGRTAAEIILTRVEMIGAVYSRKTSPEMITVFQEALEGYPISVLKKAFLRAERELEKFPTPKTMRQLCNEEMPSNSWKYHYKQVPGTDPETGAPITIYIDPDPLPGKSNELYRATDCPEGRRFLASPRELAGRKEKFFAPVEIVDETI